MSDSDGYFGVQRPDDTGDEFNALGFIIRQILNGRSFAAVVRVSAVDTGAQTVDVQPLVNQLDGQGNAIAHEVVNDIQYVRAQGGANAIILDPEPGDIGLCVFCDRDISSVKSTRDAANPGSMRRSDMADGVYVGGLLNGDPQQYVQFTSAGIKILSPYKITLQAPEVDIVAPVVDIQASTSATITTPIFTVNGATQLNGDATSSGTVTGAADVVGGGKSLKGHKHGGVKAGVDESGAPV